MLSSPGADRVFVRAARRKEYPGESSARNGKGIKRERTLVLVRGSHRREIARMTSEVAGLMYADVRFFTLLRAPPPLHLSATLPLFLVIPFVIPNRRVSCRLYIKAGFTLANKISELYQVSLRYPNNSDGLLEAKTDADSSIKLKKYNAM